MKRASKVKLIYALLPLQLEMAICYQYGNAYFPAPYGDNQLLCSLCGPKRGHEFNLRASNTTTRFSSKSSCFCNFTPRMHQKRSQKVRNPNFPGGACPQIPLACILCALKSHTGIPLFKILDTPLTNVFSHPRYELRTAEGMKVILAQFIP